MKTIVLEVARSDVEEKVAQSTVYLGLKTPVTDGRGDLIDRVATVDNDSFLLSGFIAEAYAEAVERLKGFVKDAELSDGGVRLVLEVSGAYDDAVTPTVATGFCSFLVAYVMSRWLRLSFPGKETEWDQEAEHRLTAMERNLYHRRRPKRLDSKRP